MYHDAARKARHDLLFFMHEDLYLPPGWEANVARALQDLEARDRTWGVIGAVGAVSALVSGISQNKMYGHWCDPNGYYRDLPCPHEVDCLDEQWLGFRKSRGFGFDPSLPGFHCYGIDLSLAARQAGHKSYAIDAFVWHKYRDRDGSLITCVEASPKILARQTAEYRSMYNRSAVYVGKKWDKYLPFVSTSWSWS